MTCLNIALGAWTTSNGNQNLITLLDEAFAAVTTP